MTKRLEKIESEFSGTRKKIQKISYEVENIFLEREEEIPLILQTMLSGQNLIFIAEPGTGKGGMIREITRRIISSKLFESQCHPQASADTFLGPTDIKKYLEEGRFEHQIEGFLPAADLAFIDEVGQCSPDTFLALPSLLNPEERSLFMPGKGEIPTELFACFSASNEFLPDELAKIWDRFTIRKYVSDIVDPENLKKLLTGESALKVVGDKTTITLKEMLEAKEEVAKVKLPGDMIDMIMQVHSELATQGLRGSSRTWITLVGDVILTTGEKRSSLIKASAWYNGRDSVEGQDLLVLKNCIWNEPSEQRKMERIISKIACPSNIAVLDFVDKAEETYNAVLGSEANINTLVEARDKLMELVETLKGMKETDETRKGLRKIASWTNTVIRRVNKIAGV